MTLRLFARATWHSTYGCPKSVVVLKKRSTKTGVPLKKIHPQMGEFAWNSNELTDEGQFLGEF